ncbi:hypothetical protein HanRHA438_Chr03g0145131 [Helianthus annuus]|nr:hypothetical protein HanRHA438_Chr03g0145131 [Helianthus annuus]
MISVSKLVGDVVSTRRATFLNLFIALNCFSLPITALSSGVSGASPSSFIHGKPETFTWQVYCSRFSWRRQFDLRLQLGGW